MRRKSLPQLRKVTYKNKKHRYHIKDSTTKRRRAINEGVRKERKKTKKNMQSSAAAKKARFNVLRIYRRYKNPKECEILTRDMKYMDKKYGLGTTKNICKKTKKMKGGGWGSASITETMQVGGGWGSAPTIETMQVGGGWGSAPTTETMQVGGGWIIDM